MPSANKYDLTFFTATILEWKSLLTDDVYKDMIIDSLRFHVADNRIQVNAFVIMNNHIHLIRHILHPYKTDEIHRDFLGFTAKAIIRHLKQHKPQVLNSYQVNARDRQYQVWERNPLSVGIWSEEILKQKLDYIHNNPVKAGYCSCAEEYKYSTAAIYNGMHDQWDFITPCFI